MQMARCALLLLAFTHPAAALSARKSPEPATARIETKPSSRNIPKPASPKLNIHANSRSKETLVSPIMVVIQDGVAGDAPAGDVSKSCQQEMETTMMNRTKMEQAQACDFKKENFTEAAFASLRNSSVTPAIDAVEKSFHVCGGFSGACAKELAPTVVMKMRLAGVTIDDNCKKVAMSMQEMQEKANVTCEDESAQAMVQALNDKDLNGAMSAAQHGLQACQEMKAPCDFQLAPILVMQLMQQVMGQREQEMQQVLLAGMHQAEEMSKKIGAAKGDNTTRGQKPTKNNRHAISLLTVADRVRFTSRA